MLIGAIFISVIDLNHLIILLLQIVCFVILQPTTARIRWRIVFVLDHDVLVGFLLGNLPFIRLVQALNVYH